MPLECESSALPFELIPLCIVLTFYTNSTRNLVSFTEKPIKDQFVYLATPYCPICAIKYRGRFPKLNERVLLKEKTEITSMIRVKVGKLRNILPGM